MSTQSVTTLSPYGAIVERAPEATQRAEASAKRLEEIAAEKRQGRDPRVARELIQEEFTSGNAAKIIEGAFLRPLRDAETMLEAAAERRQRSLQHATHGVELDGATAAELRTRASRLDRMELESLVRRQADAGEAAMVAALTTLDPAPEELRLLDPEVAADVTERLSRARFPDAWEAIEARESEAGWIQFNVKAVREELESRLGFKLPTPEPAPKVFR